MGDKDVSAAVAEAVQPSQNATLAVDATACSLELDQVLKVAAGVRRPGYGLTHTGSNSQRQPLEQALGDVQAGAGRHLHQIGPGGKGSCCCCTSSVVFSGGSFRPLHDRLILP